MEFVKKSNSVIDVKIPEGSVIRITDKQTGDVLWEKKRDLASHAAWHSRLLYDFAASLNSVPTEANGHRITFIADDTEYTGSNANQIALRIGYGSTGTAKQSTASFTGPRYNYSGASSSWHRPGVSDFLCKWNLNSVFTRLQFSNYTKFKTDPLQAVIL